MASGDFGIGIGTTVLSDLLGFVKYVDTLYVVNTLKPHRWALTGAKKIGPSKSPDYLAYDARGRISIIECKGTQTSHYAMKGQIASGVPQKSSLVPQGTQQVIHQLVVGTFIPQFGSKQKAVVRVADPDNRATRNELKEFSAKEIRESMNKVAVAKEISAFGLQRAAGGLVESPRVSRRLQPLREWSHEQINEVFPRSPRTRSANGARASR